MTVLCRQAQRVAEPPPHGQVEPRQRHGRRPVQRVGISKHAAQEEVLRIKRAARSHGGFQGAAFQRGRMAAGAEYVTHPLDKSLGSVMAVVISPEVLRSRTVMRCKTGQPLDGLSTHETRPSFQYRQAPCSIHVLCAG